ncbi:hypothetical protein KSP40_PGU000215 [Platanthera guangdongensis]|uniref:Uncharacterized protein n=1 Tax=Platanthera guangdongensis TaxID=2320717 RepID=A0ABR2LQZ9_9ASPA
MTEGSAEWVVNLFVFYSRLSLPPSTHNLLEFRHRNFANLNCNKLFLYCKKVIEEFRGCCCSNCTHSHRLRHVLPGYKRYQKWHRYGDGSFYMYSIVLVFF